MWVTLSPLVGDFLRIRLLSTAASIDRRPVCHAHYLNPSPKDAGASCRHLGGETLQAGTLCCRRYMLELPVSYDSLVENLMDPSHIHFSHHNVIGSRDR